MVFASFVVEFLFFNLYKSLIALGGTMAQPEEMYQCQTASCGYIYDPDRGDRRGKIPKGTQFKDLPDDWKCPVCGAGKKMFKPLG
jgi:rubredoxin